jgi:hypothetical protein
MIVMCVYRRIAKYGPVRVGKRCCRFVVFETMLLGGVIGEAWGPKFWPFIVVS